MPQCRLHTVESSVAQFAFIPLCDSRRFEEERNQEWPQGSGSDIVKYNVNPEISSIFANPNVSSNPSVYTPSLRPNIHALAQYAQTVPVSHSETELESNLNQDMGGIKNYADFENSKLQKRKEEYFLSFS